MPMPAPATIRELVERFESHEEKYTAPSYNEEQTRIEFLNPFFESLGWDVSNKNGYAEAYKDVIHEDKLVIAGTSKSPDYAFRIGGVRKFYLEAKKPSVHVGSDQKSAIQLRRYGWSGKLPLSVLSNFKELCIFDTQVRPAKKDTALTARLRRFKYDQYDECWDEIHGILSKDAILKGSFDKYISTAEDSRERIGVDDSFLKQIETWRADLADHIYKRNPKISEVELRVAVQAIIDRIVFLRIAEDRGSEPANQLSTKASAVGSYKALLKIFEAADKKYNSGLFHLGKWKSDSPVDTLTPTLNVGDKVLNQIIRGLYYPESPYEFSAIPSDVLGHVYERFLGRTITIEGGRARAEYKPEVKKASGVYYTPTYIADYIVERTVGDLIGDPKKADSAPSLRIIDPACGSGSFLLATFSRLLDWYEEFYRATIDPATAHSDGRVVKRDDGTLALSLTERKRILTAHIFGVDIDAQAVEVAKLSLLLKVLEGHRYDKSDSLKERLLPDLDANFRCGNSLIDPSHFERHGSEAEDHRRFDLINAFDWSGAFSHLGDAPYFDVVVGNPPYFSIDKTWGAGDSRLASIKHGFPDIHTDKTDIYYYFIELGLRLAKSRVGYICSRAFLEAAKASKLRERLATLGVVEEVVDFANFHVFDGVGIATAIIILNNDVANDSVEVARLNVGDLPIGDRSMLGLMTTPTLTRFQFPRAKLSAEPWNLSDSSRFEVFAKIDEAGQPLAEFMATGQGMQTGANEVFGGLTDKEVKSWKITPKLVKKRVRNTDIHAFHISDRGERILYLEDVTSYKTLPAKVRERLEAAAKKLRARAAVKRENCLWWQYSWPLNSGMYSGSRIICPYLATDNRFAIDESFEYLGLTDTTVIFDGDQPEAIEYICALLNSELLTHRFKGLAKLKGNGIYEYFAGSVGRLPIKRIDFGKAREKASHDKVVSIYRSITKARSSGGQEARVAVLRKNLEREVLGLYGISDAEVSKIS